MYSLPLITCFHSCSCLIHVTCITVTLYTGSISLQVQAWAFKPVAMLWFFYPSYHKCVVASLNLLYCSLIRLACHVSVSGHLPEFHKESWLLTWRAASHCLTIFFSCHYSVIFPTSSGFHDLHHQSFDSGYFSCHILYL